jgi:hypothetical protein
MGVSVAVTRVAANTSTGNQTISTNDLGGLTPKAVMLIVTRGVTDGTAADGAGFYWGLSDGTNEATGAYESQHAQATMDAQTNQDTTANRILTIYDGTADSGVEATADFVSFGADGVTIDWTDAPVSAFLITAIFFAGTDLSANVGRQDLGSIADALIANTSVGFEADLVFSFWNHTLDGGTLSIGVVHNDRAGTVSQRSAGHIQRTGFSSSQVGAHMRDGEGLMRLTPGTQALSSSGAFQTFDSSGWDVQLGGGGNPINADYAWLALRFGSSPVVSSKVYTYSTPTGTGSNTDSTPNFTPQFVMYLATRAAAADTSETDADGGTFGVVTVDADDLYTQSISDEDAAAESNTQSLSDNQLNLPTHTGGSGHQATLTSLGSTGPVWNYSATDGTARLWPALAIEVFSAGLSATVNQATETDTAQAITRLKTKVVGQVTETDLAQAIQWAPKHRTVSQATEADTAQAITRVKQKAIGQVTETDLAQAVQWAPKHRTVAQVTETDLAQAITRVKQKVIGQVTETDSAQAITSRKLLAIGQVSETDLAQPISAGGEIVVSVGQVTETDAAQAVTRIKIRALGQTTESDAAQPVSRIKSRTIAQTTEADLAQAVGKIKILVISQVSETDLAQALFRSKRVAVAQVIEVDLSQAITRLKRYVIGQVVETDFAQSIAGSGALIDLFGVSATITEVATPGASLSIGLPTATITPVDIPGS